VNETQVSELSRLLGNLFAITAAHLCATVPFDIRASYGFQQWPGSNLALKPEVN
jgi:hypothetical protein